jgi:hypothetical protein
MKKNVGTLDAYIRITLGLAMLGTGIIVKSPIKIAIGSGKVAEGVTRFCPMLYLMNLNTICKKDLKDTNKNSVPLFSGL